MEENNQSQGNIALGFVLLKDANFDWPRFKHNLKEDWGITFNDEIKDGAVVFNADGMNCACSLLPTPVPNQEAENCARNNLLWKDGAEQVAKHAAHVMVAVMQHDDPLDQQIMLCKLASAVLKLKNTIGFYKNPTVYERDFFIETAENIKENKPPIPLMVYIGMYMTENAVLNAFTYGMRFYGYEEFEVIGSKAQPQELYGFMLSVAHHVIWDEQPLHAGDTIDITDDISFSVTMSKAINFDGDSMKIDFKV